MKDISLHILDVAENALAAGATRIEVVVREMDERDELHVEIRDDGRGMTAEQIAGARDPFYTTKPGKRIGLGLALLGQAAREAGGRMEIDSAPGAGTRVHAVFGLRHPDRKPLGDIEGTCTLLQLSHPEVEVVLRQEP